MNGTQAKVCLFVATFKFKVALLDRVTQTVQTRLRSDRDYNTTIGSVRGYGTRWLTTAKTGYDLGVKKSGYDLPLVRLCTGTT